MDNFKRLFFVAVILLVVFLLVVLVGSILTGCAPSNGDTVSDESVRFVTTEDRYVIDNADYKVCYDSVTNIVYLVAVRNTVVVPFYGSDGKPMTLDEYTATKKR